MASTIERQRTIGIARQTARATANTVADYWLRKISFDAGRQVEHINDESAIGVNAETSGVGRTRQWSEPQISAYVDINAYGLLEYAQSDSYSVVTSGDTGVYDHTFKVGATTRTEKFLTINADDPTLGDENFADMLINTFNTTINMNERLMMDVGMAGKYPVSGTNTPVIATPQYFYGRLVTVELAASVSALTGATFGATTVTFNRNNNVDLGENSAFQLGNIDIADHMIQSRNAEVTIGKVLTANTYIELQRLATLKSVRITIADTGTTIGSASNPTITITFPYVSMKVTESGDNNARRIEELAITPHYGADNADSTSYLYKVVVRNTVADYAAV